MPDEPKVPEVPVPEVVETPEPSKDESLIDNRRQEIENLVIAEGGNVIPAEEPEEPAVVPEVPKEPEPSAEDPLERIKKSVQKRIDKVVAQKKSVEEERDEALAELQRLKANVPEPQTPKDDTPPTIEQVEAYIIRMREEGNTKEEIAATRYLIKLEKESAIKEVQETQKKAQEVTETQKRQQLSDWSNLCRDYEDYDDGKPNVKSDLSLQNQNGLLYTTALGLYNDKDLHANFYNDPNVINGFRRAVADAYREIHQQGLVKKTPKGEPVIPRDPSQVLADPSTTEVEEPAQSKSSASLSTADRVREEIKARKKNRYIRKLPKS